MTTPTWPLTTPRLTLRPVEEGDIDALWSYLSLPEVRTWVSGARDRSELRERFLEPPEESHRLVVLESGEVVGDVVVVVKDPWSQTEVADQARATQGLFGWGFRPDVSGRGLATEAVAELVRHSFEDLGLRRVVAECFTDNEPSWRLMERVGMRREAHHVRSALHRDRGWQDEYSYALLGDEWRQRSATV